MKPKSNIPWENFNMRKHGVNLRNQLRGFGINVSVAIKCYKTLKADDDSAKFDEQPIWVSTDVGTC